MQKKTFKYHCIVTRIMASIRLDEILLLKGKGFVRKKDNLPLNITDGDKFVTYGSVNGNFEQMSNASSTEEIKEFQKCLVVLMGI